MHESKYRASRTARLLGNPSVFTLVETMLGEGTVTPTSLSRRLKRDITTVSNYLKSLKLAEVVRFESDGHHNWYAVKYPDAVRRVMRSLTDLARRSARGIRAAR
jgi:predicted transcriptional regulator